ncbi:MAG: 7-cyano-7-deazaguanine synthase QueC [candidate division WOR-3 bacterium]|nr:MAG: 7-cyano-7-deazaguanine synthase QueC [candidate division WOR-3 bacterium]
MKAKSIILLSGGLDSTVSAAIARQETSPLFAMTFDYGQRATAMELTAAKKICRVLKIKHKTVKLPFFEEFNRLMLLRSKNVDIKKLRKVESLWVPNRNGLFINIAACYAEYCGAELIITGFNREEACEFPDNSAEFMVAINESLHYSTLNRVKVKSYVADFTKKEIYQLGLKHNAPLELIYSCYLGEKEMCGKCASCKRLIEARK